MRAWKIIRGRLSSSRNGSVLRKPVESNSVALAGRLLLSTLWAPEIVDDEAWFASLLPMRLSSFRHGGDDLSRHPKAVAPMVLGHLVHYQPETRSECLGFTEGLGTDQVRDGMDLAA